MLFPISYNDIKPPFGAEPNHSHPLMPSGGLWTFNAGAGDELLDSSLERSHGEIIEAIWNDGPDGKVLDVNGVTGAVPGDVPVNLGLGTMNAVLSGAPAITILALVKINSINGDGRPDVICEVFIDGNTDGANLRVVKSGAGFRINAGGRSKPSDGFQSDTGTNELSFGVWRLLATTLDFENNLIRMSVNGLEDLPAKSVTFGNNVYEPGNPTTSDNIGGPQLANDFFLNGAISMVGIFPRRVFPNEISELSINQYAMFQQNSNPGIMANIGIAGLQIPIFYNILNRRRTG